MLGCKMGGSRLRIDVPRLFRLYRGGRLQLDQLVSSRRPLRDINGSVELARHSRNLRHVIVFPGQPDDPARDGGPDRDSN